MKQVTEHRIQVWKEHHERYACTCENKALRKRVVKGGAVQYVYQCQRCGEVSLQAVARTKAFELCEGKEPASLDTKLREEWQRKKSEAAAKIDEVANNKFWSGYSEYLATPEWAERRRLVLKRAAGICEGCGIAAAAEVHHLSYEHVGSEFLFELVAICQACHKRIHPEEPS
jgi:hypothetical protein